MSDADGGLAAEVLKPGNCLRDVYLGDHKYVIRRSWWQHTLGGGVELTTTLLDSKGQSAHTKTVYTDKTYLALSSKGEEVAEVVLKNKRDYWWNRQQVRQPRGCSSSSKKRRTADSDIFCPIITALRGGRITRFAHLAELGEVTVMKDTGRWRDVGSEEPVSGEEEVTVRKVTRKYRVKTRMASCFCSSCQISKYEECHVYRTYSALVPALMDGEVKETVITDTRVAPAGVDQPQEITFPPPERRNARCRELLGPSGERAIRLLLVTCGRTLHGRKSHH